MVDATNDGDEEPQEEEEPKVPLSLRVSIKGARGPLAEGEGPLSFSYSVPAKEKPDVPEGEEGPEPEEIAGDFSPPDEVEEGETGYEGYIRDHPVFPPGTQEHDELLLALLNERFTIKVGDVGEFTIGMEQLVWPPKPDPDDDDTILDNPKIQGWFKVIEPEEEEPAAPEGEEGAEPQEVEEKPISEVHACLELTEFVMDAEEVEDSNVLTITLKEVHNLPKAWQASEDGAEHLYLYSASYTVPAANGPRAIEATAEDITPAEQEEQEEPEEGEGAEGAEGAEGDEGAEGAEGAEGVEKGLEELVEPPAPKTMATLQHTLREVAEEDEAKAQRIEFNHECVSFMSPSAIRMLKTAISLRIPFPIDFKRQLKDGADYVYAQKYRGLANLNLGGILDEDATQITVRCPVGPHKDYSTPSEEDLEALPPPEGEPEIEEILHNGFSANPYLLAETYVMLTVTTRRPINVKPPPPPKPLPRVSDILPQRESVKSYIPQVGGRENFRFEIKNMIGEILGEYTNLVFRDPESSTNTNEVVESRRQQMIYQLNSSGRYHTYKQKLKKAVIRIAKERFHELHFGAVQMDLTDEAAKLNAFVRDETNEQLVKEFLTEVPEAPIRDAEITSSQKLETQLANELRLAEEAELRLDYVKACTHLQRRIVAAPKNADLWFDLGCYTMRSRDIVKAEECFRHALELDDNHVFALLAYGVLLSVRDKFPESEYYFTQAADKSPTPLDVLSWACCVVFYDLESRDLERRTAIKQMLTAEKKAATGKKSPYLRAAGFCVELYATQLVERAMTQELMKNGDSEELRVMLGRIYLHNAQYEKCRQHLNDALSKDKKCAVAMTLLGHCAYMEADWQRYRCDRVLPPYKEAVQYYEKALQQKSPNIEMLQYIRLARIQIAARKYQEATDVLHRACKLQPSATTWLGVAICHFHLGQLQSNNAKHFEIAEEALQEAAILDSQNAEVWGLSCLISLAQSMPGGKVENVYQPKAEEAVTSLRQALLLGLSLSESFPTQASILEQAGMMMNKVSRFAESAAAIRRALDTAEVTAEAMHYALKVEAGDAFTMPDHLTVNKEGLVVMQDGTVINPNNRDACNNQLFNLCKIHGDTSELLNDMVSAANSYQKVIEVLQKNPNNPSNKTDLDLYLKKIVPVLETLGKSKEAAKYKKLRGNEAYTPGRTSSAASQKSGTASKPATGKTLKSTTGSH